MYYITKQYSIMIINNIYSNKLTISITMKSNRDEESDIDEEDVDN